MRRERLTPAHVRRAVRLYNELAWPADCGKAPPVRAEDFEDCATLEALFGRFEKPKGKTGPSGECWVLRLGNTRYAYMKLVVWEYLVRSEYFLSVDTHDDLHITPDMPDYEGWCLVRAYNHQLKERIEAAWRAAGLPTHENLRELMEGIAELEQGEEKSQRIVLVDDEQDVCRGLAAVLSARGYQVRTAFTGAEALEHIREKGGCDLVVLDYSLPDLDGQEVLRRIRADPELGDLPVLLATARSLELRGMSPATGFLLKPYPREVLFRMIQEMLAAGGRKAAPAE